MAGPSVVSLGPAPERSRARVLAVVAACVVGVAVVAAAVIVPVVVLGGQEPPPDLREVRTYADLPLDHTLGDVDYPVSPPVGGPHAPVWLDCGVYDEPVSDEAAVHDLEHGTTWLSYDPRALSEDEVAALAEALPSNGIMAPYPGLESPVVVTVWGAQLHLDGVDDARLPLFLREYAGAGTAPEPWASCAGGVTDPEGGAGGGSGGTPT
jgi:hypothetical protein